MPALDAERRILQARHAAAIRYGHDQVATETARDLAAAKLADYITKTVDASPALTDAQRDRLALLLRGGGARDAAA